MNPPPVTNRLQAATFSLKPELSWMLDLIGEDNGVPQTS